jgi:hypothetical protein
MTVFTRRFSPVDPRLGRHVRHDTASYAFAEPLLPRVAIRSVRWTRHTGVLDQGPVGSCVPNAGTGLLACDALGYTGQSSLLIPKTDSKKQFKAGSRWALDETFAQNGYRLVTRLDPYSGQWEPDDTGSDGLSLAKALVMLGLSDIYTHAFSYQAAVSAAQKGGVLFGTVWYNSMFDPQPDGRVIVDPSSGVAGGHEYLCREFDADADHVWIDNSWGESWGLDGRGYLTGADMTVLLKAQGDVTVPHLVGMPPPSPAVIDDATFWATAKAWAAAKGYS